MSALPSISGKVRASIMASGRLSRPFQNQTALSVLLRVRSVTGDTPRYGFRPLVLDLIERVEGETRRMAFYALYNLPGREPGDLDRVLSKLEGDAVLRSRGSHLLHMYSDGNIRGEAAETVLRMLDGDPRTVREVLRGLWGAKVTPAVEARE